MTYTDNNYILRTETGDQSWFWNRPETNNLPSGYFKSLGQVNEQEAKEAEKKVAAIFGQISCVSNSKGRYLWIQDEVLKKFRVKSVSIFRNLFSSLPYIPRSDSRLPLGKTNYNLTLDRRNRLRALRRSGFDFQFSFEREIFSGRNIESPGYLYLLDKSLTIEQISERTETIANLWKCRINFLKPDGISTDKHLFIEDDQLAEVLRKEGENVIDRNRLTARQNFDLNFRELFIDELEDFLIRNDNLRWIFVLLNELGGKWHIDKHSDEHYGTLICECANVNPSKVRLILRLMGMHPSKIEEDPKQGKFYVSLKNVERDMAFWISFIETSVWSVYGAKIIKAVFDEKNRELEYLKTITGTSRSVAFSILNYVDNSLALFR